VKPLRVLLMGEEGAGLQALRLVLQGGHHVAGVVTSTRPTGTPIRAAAAALGCPVWQPGEVKSEAFLDTVRPLDVDLLLNVHALVILSPAVLAVPRIGAFNLHPGPLPAYAGLAVPSWAIYHGETRHAVTLHWMEADVDAGPIVAEAWMDVAPGETGLSLSLKCIREGLPLVDDLLHRAARDPADIPRRTQPVGDRRFFPRRPPHDGRLRWPDPSETIARLVRAADYRPFPSPWGAPWTVDDSGSRIGVLRAEATADPASAPPGTVGELTDAGALVATGTTWLLVRSLETAAGPRPPADVLATGQRLGESGRRLPISGPRT